MGLVRAHFFHLSDTVIIPPRKRIEGHSEALRGLDVVLYHEGRSRPFWRVLFYYAVPFFEFHKRPVFGEYRADLAVF